MSQVAFRLFVLRHLTKCDAGVVRVAESRTRGEGGVFRSWSRLRIGECKTLVTGDSNTAFLRIEQRMADGNYRPALYSTDGNAADLSETELNPPAGEGRVL